MIPFQDENPSGTTPFVTLLLIVANAALFAYFNIIEPARYGRSSAVLFTFVPYQWTHPLSLVSEGSPYGPATIITSMFLHAGWLHLASNMLYLWIFGDNVEDRMGHVRFLSFYLFCGVAAAVAHAAMNPMSKIPTMGASGAIAGILGAYLVLFPTARVRTLFIFIIIVKVFRIPAFVLLLYWISLQALSAYAEWTGAGSASGGGIAWFAHIGGFLAGLGSVWFFRKSTKRRQKRNS